MLIEVYNCVANKDLEGDDCGLRTGTAWYSSGGTTSKSSNETLTVSNNPTEILTGYVLSTNLQLQATSYIRMVAPSMIFPTFRSICN